MGLQQQKPNGLQWRRLCFYIGFQMISYREHPMSLLLPLWLYSCSTIHSSPDAAEYKVTVRFFSLRLRFFPFSVFIVASRDVFGRGPMRVFAIREPTRYVLFHALFQWSTLSCHFPRLLRLYVFIILFYFIFVSACHCNDTLHCNLPGFLHLKCIAIFLVFTFKKYLWVPCLVNNGDY